MAEIYSSSQVGSAQKTWLWPVYDAGKANEDLRITRQNSSHQNNTNPTPGVKKRILGLMSQSRAQTYTSTGGIVSNADVHFRPGTFFDAMA